MLDSIATSDRLRSRPGYVRDLRAEHGWSDGRHQHLPETRTKEWLLLLEFRKRETFAYSCEAYGWIVEHSSSKAERLALAQRFAAHGFGQCEETMDPDEVTDIVQEACQARNGWKVILGRCAPEKRHTRRMGALADIKE